MQGTYRGILEVQGLVLPKADATAQGPEPASGALRLDPPHFISNGIGPGSLTRLLSSAESFKIEEGGCRLNTGWLRSNLPHREAGLELRTRNSPSRLLTLKLSVELKVDIITACCPNITLLLGSLRRPGQTLSTLERAAGRMPMGRSLFKKLTKVLLLVTTSKSVGTCLQTEYIGGMKLELQPYEVKTKALVSPGSKSSPGTPTRLASEMVEMSSQPSGLSTGVTQIRKNSGGLIRNIGLSASKGRPLR